MSNNRDFFKGAYVGNEFVYSKKGTSWCQKNPFNLEQIFEWHDQSEFVDTAIENAQKAFEKWSRLSQDQRNHYLLQLQSSFKKREAQFEELIILEAGRTRWEARQEAQALSKKIQVSMETMLPLIKEMEEKNSSAGQRLSFKARGLCVVLGPFNFPVHLANGHIIPALLAGNVILFKPSEYGVACANLYTEAIQEAGFPAGVFQLLPGDGQLGKQLVEHKKIDAVFFTGSYENGRKITESILKSRNHLSTMLALEMGGKNALVVHEDAYFELAISSALFSSFASAGQRCTCSSRIFVHNKHLEKFTDVFVEKTKKLKWGDPQDEKTFMGPLIHKRAVQNYIESLQKAKADGLEVLLDSTQPIEKSCLVTPAVYKSSEPQEDVFKYALQEEFFGPQTTIIPYQTNEDLKFLHEASMYGLATSVFSASQEFFDFCDQSFDVGLLNWNKPSVGASSSLPFGGSKKSGNNWPAGLFSYFYCTRPRSSLLGESKLDSAQFPKSLQEVL